MSNGHAKLSPSGASRWVACPGSPAAEAGYPNDSNEHARLGTAAHELAANALQDGLEPHFALGMTMTVEGYEIEVDKDMVHYVQKYVDQVREINANADAFFVEVRVPIDHITGEDGAGGTADYIGVEVRPDVTVVRVHDLKYGQGVRVEAEDNLQLAMYALGVLRELDYLFDDDDNIQLELHIHQVRLNHLPVWHISREELESIGLRLAAAAKATLASDAPRIPGEHCRFCKHRRACPELRAEVYETVAYDPPADAEAVADAMPMLKMIRDWCATVEARAIELLNSGHDVPGYKLVEGRRSRVWNEEPERWERQLKKYTGLYKRDLYEQKPISVAQAEKMVPKAEWDRINKMVEYRAGKPTIAPVEDKRPAVNGAEAQGFSDLTRE